MAGWETYRPDGPAHYFSEGAHASRCRLVARFPLGHQAAPDVHACGHCVRLLAVDLARCAHAPEPQPGARS